LTRRLAYALLAMAVAQVGVYLARPMTSYRLLGLGHGAQAVGLVAATFALLPLVLAIPLGRLADRPQRRRFLAAGAVAQLAGCVGLAFSHGLLALGAATAVLGLGHLALALGVQAVVARESADARHDRDFGLLTAGVSLGQLVGPLLGGFLVGHADGHALVGASTRALVVAAAFAGCATALAAAAERLPAPAGAEEGTEDRGSVRSILRLPGVPSGLLASIAVLAASDVFTAYLPVLGEQHAIAPAAVGVVLALRAAATVLARLGIGRLVAAFGRPRLIAVSTLAAAAGFAIMTFTSQLWLLALLAVVVGAGLGYGQPLSMTIVVQRVPLHARATALGVRLTGNRVGQVAAPAAAGVVAGSAGASSVFWLLSAVLAATAVAATRLPP
jgi:MFS family permease